MAESRCPLSIEESVLQMAPDLLLQDLSERKAVGLVTGLASRWHEGGLAGLARAGFDRLRGAERETIGPTGPSASGQRFSSWAKTRLRERLGSLANPEVRRSFLGG